MTDSAVASVAAGCVNTGLLCFMYCADGCVVWACRVCASLCVCVVCLWVCQ